MVKILIVDDDSATRTGLAELLTNHGYHATAVATLNLALKILRTAAPDLLIADVRLGAFNGLQLLMTASDPVPAIVITGFPDPVLESEIRRVGAEYMLKPIDAARLLALVEHTLAVANRQKRVFPA